MHNKVVSSKLDRPNGITKVVDSWTKDQIGYTNNDTAILGDSAPCQISIASTDMPDITVTIASDLQRVPTTATACVSILENFAKNTYAPATEESRLVGAGAGLNEND